MKAYGVAYPKLNKVFMHDILILTSSTQRAVIHATDDAARHSAGREAASERIDLLRMMTAALRAFVKSPEGCEKKWLEVSVSISHDAEYATAVALVPVDPEIAGMVEKNVVRKVMP